jgi:hypothetical protein
LIAPFRIPVCYLDFFDQFFFLNSCFSAVPASLLFYFPAFSDLLLFPLLCLLLVLLLCLSASTFLQSCVFAALLLPAPLLLCFLSLLSLCFSFSFTLFSSVCILNKTLNETLKKI